MKNCPNCGFQNSDSVNFCQNCGTQLSQQPSPQPNQTAGGFSQPNVINVNGQNQPVNPTPYGSPQQSTQQGPGQYQQSYQQPYPQYPTGSSASIWGPFAGMGTLDKHEGWLMDSKGSYANSLIQKVTQKFNDRNIPRATIKKEILKSRGVQVEEREYFLVKRDENSVALYITQFGQDLFVSLTSFLKTKISKARSIVLIAVSAVWLISIIVLLAMVNSFSIESSINSMFGYGGSGSGVTFQALMTSICFFGPTGLIAGLLLFVFAALSVYKYMTEKDFLFYLRKKPDAFVEDDLMAMEKAVEQTVKISLDEIGLDPNNLVLIDKEEKKRII